MDSTPKGYFKLNIDGAFDVSTKTGGGGGLIRKNNIKWIIGFASQYHSHSAVHMELMALHNGLKLAMNHTLTPLIVETDLQAFTGGGAGQATGGPYFLRRKCCCKQVGLLWERP
uniref:RNase H type-1 domain-containing protein n=1 Tax=Nicotiana tabacum TaxID=4097 RepID=A0A1S4DRB4_TOBAC|nr:PREDICTED: uncharacterized protein LOC107832620 [Nicotiana tabacum]